MAMAHMVRAVLQPHRPELRNLGVVQLRIFGSAARGDVTAASDVDILAVFDRDARPGLKMARLHRRLEEILGREVDLLRAPVEQPSLAARIEREGVDAF
ncbi:nucleotidyltransferase family protein [Parvularcula maris]|uniref:nucleotidyltransferase family protein n=1 Tax=Parvularcula maris TaxID=2965077 RepID=UPI00351A4CB5